MRVFFFVSLLLALSGGTILHELNTRPGFESVNSRNGRDIEVKEAALRGETSGTCGDSISWIFNEETATLVITRTGNMICCTSSSSPWSHLSEQVKKIDIREEVSSVDQNAFRDFTNLVERYSHP